MSAGSREDVAQGGFPHHWQATILKQRPLILPRRHYVYPREAEEVERGALELLILPPPDPAGLNDTDPFLATCALGFADPLAPTGVWTCPDPDHLCAVAGGYAYLINTTAPERFEQVSYRPVLGIHAVVRPIPLLLFIGHRNIQAWGSDGKQAWESSQVSSEGIEVQAIGASRLYGKGWDLMKDCDTAFNLDLLTGMQVD